MAEEQNTIQVDRLMQLLTRQHELYRRLRELADEQRGLVTADTPERLLGLLHERQGLVGELAKLNMQLAPFRRNWGGTYGALPERERAKAGEILDDINNMLQVILKADREDSALLSARREIVSAELKDVGDAHSANAAYARQARGQGRPSADLSG